MEVKIDDLVNAIRWKLNIPVDERDPGRHGEICARYLQTGDALQREQLNRLCRFLSDTLEQAVRGQLGLNETTVRSQEDLDFCQSLWKAIEEWVKAGLMKRSPRISGMIREAIAGKKQPQVPPTASAPAPRTPVSRPASPPPPGKPLNPPSAGVRPAPSTPAPPLPPPSPPPVSTATPPLPAPTEPTGTPNPPVSADPSTITVDEVVQPTSADMSKPGNTPRSSGPQWQYKPVPVSEPDPQSESTVTAQRSPEGYLLVGARVRGKKHKHEGTNCDDWFHTQISGRWTILAVADGAGSKKLSRVGARVSCERASQLLAERLAGVQFNQAFNFMSEEAELIQKSLFDAVRAAFFAVEKAAGDRADNPAYQKYMGRKTAPEDLSATLLLLVHTTYPTRAGEESLVMSYQVGDGVAAAINPQGKVTLLGKPDSGAYSGETDFLTSRKQLDVEQLTRRTDLFQGPLRALLVMTDGVADDYFPAEPGMSRLYADLVLNGILKCSHHAPRDEIHHAERDDYTSQKPPFDPADGRLDMPIEVNTAEGIQQVSLRSASVYASELGIPVEQLAASQLTLSQGLAGSPLPRLFESPQERLRAWLDYYHVRGSFDDRTLVVLHPEKAN